MTEPAGLISSAGVFAQRIGRNLLARAGEIVLPPACLACRRPAQDAAGLCPRCWAEMRFIERPYCDRLGLPFADDPGPQAISPAAIARPPPYGRARAVTLYDGPGRDLVHGLKYGDRGELAPAMARWMARAGADLTAGAEVLVPVPLHRARLWRRRFNQAAVLAAMVGRAWSVPAEPLALVRTRRTRQQVGLTGTERADNVRGAFLVPERAKVLIAGRRVVLVDDVLTTGATVEAATRTLLRAGAANVDVLVFALVDPAG